MVCSPQWRCSQWGRSMCPRNPIRPQLEVNSQICFGIFQYIYFWQWCEAIWMRVPTEMIYLSFFRHHCRLTICRLVEFYKWWDEQAIQEKNMFTSRAEKPLLFFSFVRNSKTVKILLSAHPSVNIHMFACSGSAWKSTTGWIVEQTLPLANIFWQHLTQRSIKGR